MTKSVFSSVFSPFASERLIHCAASARLCSGISSMLAERFDELHSGGYGERADKSPVEGKDCHRLAAFKLRKALGQNAEDPTESLMYFNQEMDEAADTYVSSVMQRVRELYARGAKPVIYIEQQVDFSRYAGVDGCFGIADCIVLADGVIDIFDMKYGRGVLIPAKDNSQLRCYALGSLQMCGGSQVSEVHLNVVQPRRDNTNSYTMSCAELLTWADTVLAPAARLVAEGGGEFGVGKHCRFCPAKHVCRKYAEANVEFLRKFINDGTGKPEKLSSEEISSILMGLDNLTSWAGAIKEWAVDQVAHHGAYYPGLKLVRGRSGRRQYTDPTAAARVIREAGFEPYEQVLKNPAKMSRMLGPTRFDSLLGSLICLPPGKLTLVPESDGRPSICPPVEVMASIKEEIEDV